MAKNSHIRLSGFKTMLGWLDSDSERAGEKYESIRSRLIKIFYARGCHLAEELADETIDRVAGKIDDLVKSYKGDPALYFYGVAKKIFLEFSRQSQPKELPAILTQKETDDQYSDVYYDCLEKCLQTLSAEQREFIFDYYNGDKQEKINRRREMMRTMKVTSEVLYIRAFRLRKQLQKCILSCAENFLCN